jgi:hypothetical protein
MEELDVFDQMLTRSERRVLARLDTPARIQAFVDELEYTTEAIYRCPLRVLRERIAHCYDGAVFAAAALRRIGEPPRILNLFPEPGQDDDHVLALIRRQGAWAWSPSPTASLCAFGSPFSGACGNS